MQTNEYAVGQEVRLLARFTNESLAPADPSTVVFKVKPPSGAIISVPYTGAGDVKKATTGVYYYDIVVDAHGEWDYRAEGSGTLNAAGENKLIVNRSPFYA